VPGYELGIALGGGAARGFFHLGVLKALHEAGIRPDCVSGTSVGSLMAAAHAAGVPVQDVVDRAATVNWGNDVFNFRRTFINVLLSLRDKFTFRVEKVPPGFLESSRISDFVNTLIGGRTLSEILPLVLSATDIVTGEKLQFCSPAVAAALAEGYAAREPRGTTAWEQAYGQHEVVVPFENVGLAVRASCCFPGVISSVSMDVPELSGDTRRRLLNDGGISEQVPTKPLRALGCRKVIGVHLGYVPQFSTVEHFVAVQMNSIQFIIRSQITESLRLADYVVYDPRIEEVSMVRMDPAVIEMGYRFTLERVDEIRQALSMEPPEPVASPVAEERQCDTAS
jgi:NTE family protein